MDVSCHSFLRMAKPAAPLTMEGGSMFAMSDYGAMRVVPVSNVMDPVKPALAASCRGLAPGLGPWGIRVPAISPGPQKTRAASGLRIMDVDATRAYLASPCARRVTGSTFHIDGSANIVA